MLNPGTRLGAFDIKALIGRGGMGEVYRARDLTLDRDVAIKVLPAGWASDPQRLARFEREARTLAAVNHPNIAQIHGTEANGPSRAIVMEFVEGDDLSRRLENGPLPLAEALSIARQVAEAIQAAHDQGIIHRDLKPANVKVTADGTVKVLDFGLAKIADPATGDVGAQTSTTMMASAPGLVIGTPAYMSPEQVKGQIADARSDVWAFACLLFEMLAGRPPFAAASTTETMAAVLGSEPDWLQLPRGTPEPVRRLLRRCLQKNPGQRLRAVADARFDIDDAVAGGPVASDTQPRRRSREWLAWAGIVVLAGAAAVLWSLRSGGEALPPVVQLDIVTPSAAGPSVLASIAVAPDGSRVLFVADSDGQPHVWIRDLDSVVARALPGTGGARFPFWSPDGRSIAFFADGLLKRLDLEGGLVRTLARATVGVGGTWNRDGVILFVSNPATVIDRVSAEAGATAPVTRLDAGHVGHAFPHFLPDGRHFLFYVTGPPDVRGIHVGQLEGGPSRRLLDADAGGVYANGHLLFIRQTNVLAQRFDLERLELKDRPFQIADGISRGPGGQYLMLSAGGPTFAFRAGAARFTRQFSWTDRAGTVTSNVGDPLGSPDGLASSPQGNQIVYFERGATSSDLWIFDVQRGQVNRFTDEADEEIFPMWARDGHRVLYTVGHNGQYALYQKDIESGRRELLLPPHVEETFACDTSPDGRSLVFQRLNPTTGFDLWALPLGHHGAPTPIVQTDADERSARISPDGRWIAYVSNTSGVVEVFVQPFPGPGRRMKVSVRGGDQLQWRADGAELFYVALDGRLNAVAIKPAADPQVLEMGNAVPLFPLGVGEAVRAVLGRNYVASADGQRFLVSRLVRETDAVPVRVVLNWRPPR